MRDAGYPASEVAAVGRASDLAVCLFSGLHRASGKPFVAHLAGTASVLASIGSPLRLVVAGLLHATYVQGRFGDGPPGATPSRRAILAGSIGGSAEEIVLRYATLPWEKGETNPSMTMDRRDPLERDVVVARLANEVEEAIDCGILFHADGEARRTLFLAAAPRWSAWARQLSQEALARALEDAAGSLAREADPGALRSDRSATYVPPALEKPTAAGRVRAVAARVARATSRVQRAVGARRRS
jgi:hypothetical protein